MDKDKRKRKQEGLWGTWSLPVLCFLCGDHMTCLTSRRRTIGRFSQVYPNVAPFFFFFFFFPHTHICTLHFILWCQTDTVKTLMYCLLPSVLLLVFPVWLHFSSSCGLEEYIGHRSTSLSPFCVSPLQPGFYARFLFWSLRGAPPRGFWGHLC